MSKFDTAKKPAAQDWTSHFIVYQLRLRGLSFRRLSRLHDYCPSAAQMVTRMPWPKMERLVADALGVPPQEIWPSRYHDDGSPKSGRGERGLGRYKPKGSTSGNRRNVEVKDAA